MGSSAVRVGGASTGLTARQRQWGYLKAAPPGYGTTIAGARVAGLQAP